MLTVKHIGDDGHEKIVSIVSVSFDPEIGVLIGHSFNGDTEWADGRAFIMNEQGKTVGVYHLKKQEQP
jgi:hypothetical protein